MQTESPILKRLGELDRTRSWLARRLGVHPSSVNRWINDPKTFTPQRQREVALALGVRVEDITPAEVVAA